MSNKHIFFEDETSEKFADAIKASYFRESPVNVCDIIENAFILPVKKIIDSQKKFHFQGGVVDQNCHFVENSMYLRKDGEGVLSEDYAFDKSKAKYVDKEVLYAGLLINHFGHFLAESTSRLWYWIENRDKNLDVAFLMPKCQAIIPQFWEFIDLIGIKREKIHIIKELTQFKRVHIPFQSHVLRSFYTDKFIVPFQYISSQFSNEKKEKIYLSRTRFLSGTCCMGEEYIENVFAKNGYKVVYPEKLNLKEQIQCIKNSSEIAGVSGTAMHLVLFADKNTPVTVLERTDVPEIEQIIINKAINAKAYNVGVNLNPFGVNHSIGPVILGITDCFAEYCQTRKLFFDLKLVNFIKKSDCKKFVKQYFEKYSQMTYNNVLAKDYPLLAKRLRFFAKAFIPFKRRLKEKFKEIRFNVLVYQRKIKNNAK